MDTFGLPEIRENTVPPNLAPLYQDIKLVLRVPIVNLIFRTLANYDDFLYLAWNQVRPNLITTNFENAAKKLRTVKISYKVPPVHWETIYTAPQINRIKEVVYAFTYVNPKLLIIACLWGESLSSRPNRGNGKVIGLIQPGNMTNLGHIPIVDIPSTSESLRNLLLDIAYGHHSIDVASDFRAFAFYPEFLKISWEHLVNYTQTDEYQLSKENLVKQAIHISKTMPYSVTINRQTLETIYPSASIAGIMGLVSMFRDFIPGLIVDCQFLTMLLSRN